MKRHWIIFASFLGLVTGCAAPTPSLLPTPYPPEYLPTVIALTSQAELVSASETALALTPILQPTLTPEPTLTLTPGPTLTPTAIPGHDLGAIRFLAPGPMSKVVSPISLRANVISGSSQKIQIDLYGEDGRLLARELRNLLTTREGAFVSMRIPFEIRAVAELGRITISTLDAEGRLQALNSVRVLLLSEGVNEITTPGNPAEPVGIFSPTPREVVSGGVLRLRGDIWPYNLNPVVLELVDPQGKSLGLRIITVDTISPQLFETTIPYRITEPTAARLILRQDDDRIPGLFYAFSREILLNP
jgi:hypothetical protein